MKTCDLWGSNPPPALMHGMLLSTRPSFHSYLGPEAISPAQLCTALRGGVILL